MFKWLLRLLAALWIGWDAAVVVSKESAARDPLSPENPSRKAGYELSDAWSKGIAAVGVAIIVGTVLMHVGLGLAFSYLKHRLARTEPQHASSEITATRQEPPPPRLQSNPTQDYQAYRAQQEKILSSYGWVDRKSGVARIPIERAMEILSHEK